MSCCGGYGRCCCCVRCADCELTLLLPSFPSEVTNRDVVDALNAMRTSLLTTNDSGGAETMYGGGLGGMLDYLS